MFLPTSWHFVKDFVRDLSSSTICLPQGKFFLKKFGYQKGQGRNLGETCVAWVWVLSCFHHVWLFATPWTISPPVSSVHGILQARILEWVATPISSQLRDWTSLVSPTLAGRFFTISTSWEAWDFCYVLHAKLLSHVWLFEAPWTIAWQAPLWTLLRPSKSQGSLKLNHPLQSLVH